MAVSVLERPQGYVLGDCYSATVSEAYAGYATVNRTSHGLSDGDYVYITSNIESYNGFWFVNAEDNNYFKIRRYSSAEDQAYIVDATITYCEVDLVHGWNSVHLPITYRLRSDKYPTNEVDTARTISSYGNDNGYVCLTLSGAVGSAPYPEPYESIIIEDTPNNRMDGVYQVVEVINSTTITINLAYSDDYNFGSGTVNRYYDNYNIIVRVYAGLDSDHAWYTKKPYTLIATLNYTPDLDNEVFFSINDILKGEVETKNNLQLDTLPNNIDAFTRFYITFAESYDDALGSNYTLSTYTSDYTNDSENFQGYGINSKLPFKNTHSGSMSAYVSPIQFLTLFTSPIKMNDKYFELSFINNGVANLFLRRSGANTAIENYDQGVYRVQITQIGVYSIHDGSSTLSNEIEVVEDETCTAQSLVLCWLNYLGGFDYFNFKAEKEYTIDITETGKTNQNIMANWPRSFGQYADTIEKQTFRRSRKGLVVRSQYVTSTELEAIQYIKTSPLVQIIESRSDRRTVIVDDQSFTLKKDRQDLFDISFSLTYTDDIPSQSL